ncbi:MAG TPA: LuxR C-terminal-related transcriptional regulator [Myxococcaceae bacterium]|nr:LuxR C-terminal-related transcriptional regulator [Myxococcaceae bacterium]
MTAPLPAERANQPEPCDPSELVTELTRLALGAACKAEFRGRALALLSRALPFDRAVWEEVPPFGDFRVVYPGLSWLGSRDGEAWGPACVMSGPLREEDSEDPALEGELRSVPGRRAVLRLDLERFGRTRAVLTVERGGWAFGASDVDWLRALLPTLLLADEGTATSASPSRALTPREADVVEYVRLGYTNAQIALATGRSVAAVRNVLVRIFDKTGVRTRAQLVGGPLTTSGLTRREREIVEKLRAGLTNREIGRDLGISANTVRNTLSRLFEKVGVSTRSELMGALAAGPPETP